MSQYVAAIDQGTTSTRCMIFDHDGRVISTDQREHRQHFPQAGWVEHDPLEIWANTLRDYGVRACGVLANVGQDGEVERFVAEAAAELGRVDLLVSHHPTD